MIIAIFYVIFVVLIVSLTSSSKPSDPNLQKVEQGTASKITYSNHSYVVWSINWGGGIVHDPDCQCLSKFTAINTETQ